MNNGDRAHVNGTAASNEFVVNHALHRMGGIGLPKVQSGVKKPDALAVTVGYSAECQCRAVDSVAKLNHEVVDEAQAKRFRSGR